MEARASAKYLRGSAQKARLVIDMIRGKNVNQALAILRYSNKRAALGIEKCVKSAIANANEAAEKANVSVDPDELWLKAAYVDRGPTKHRRRVRPAPQGRAYREQRHFCHVTVLVASEDKEGGAKKADAAGRGKKSAGKKGATDKSAKAAETKAAAAETKKAAARKGGAKKAAASEETDREKTTTTKRASKKTEAAPSEETTE